MEARMYLGTCLQPSNVFRVSDQHILYRVFKAQADWTFILPSKFPAKELRHLPRKISPRGTMC
jgi:hypothetical protein